MNDYTLLRVEAEPCNSDITDLLAALLADCGFESFVPDDTGLDAYIPVEAFSEKAVNEALEDFAIPTTLKLSHQTIEGQDWNSEWEKNYFKPILIGDYLIRSSFHTDLPEAEHDIIIDPRMAFGTGHHATTTLMAKYLMSLTLSDKTVIDMGTGTGILAILAKMRGASTVFGIEIDPPAYENAVDNASLNNVELKLMLGDAGRLAETSSADVLVANINRNIILGDLDKYAAAMKPGATMLLSGFYTEDIPMIEEAAKMYALSLQEVQSQDNWAGLRLEKSM